MYQMQWNGRHTALDNGGRIAGLNYTFTAWIVSPRVLSSSCLSVFELMPSQSAPRPSALAHTHSIRLQKSAMVKRKIAVRLMRLFCLGMNNLYVCNITVARFKWFWLVIRFCHCPMAYCQLASERTSERRRWKWSWRCQIDEEGWSDKSTGQDRMIWMDVMIVFGGLFYICINIYCLFKGLNNLTFDL